MISLLFAEARPGARLQVTIYQNRVGSGCVSWVRRSENWHFDARTDVGERFRVAG
jgi:hypothetical protein